MATMDAAGAAEGIAVDFDGWAELSARLLGLDPEARVDLLEERDLPIEAWDRADGHWNRVLAGEIITGNMDRAKEYGRLCAVEMVRRKGVPTPGPKEPEVIPAETSHLGEAPVPLDVDVVVIAPPPAAEPVAGESPSAPSAPVQKFDATPPPPVARARPMPVFETAPVDDLPPGPALPFVPLTAPASVARMRKTEVLPVFLDPNDRSADTTQDGPIVRSEPALPFGAQLAPLRLLADAARDVSRRPEHFVWETEPPSERDPAGGTVEARIDPANLHAALPFPMAAAAIPAVPAPSPDAPPVLTLEQYASLCATLVTFPAEKTATLARYGILTDEAAAALRERWRGQFDGDPPTLARWRALFGEYSAWLCTPAGHAEHLASRRAP
jgi:hypothetical protein